MPKPFDHVSPGTKISRPSAEEHNGFVDAARFARSFPKREGGGGCLTDDPQSAIIRVCNTLDLSVDAGGVVGLGNAIIVPTDALVVPQVVVEAKSPTDALTAAGAYGILARPLAKDAVSLVYIDGVFPAKVNFAGADDKFAKVTAGTTANLDSDAGNGQYSIIWKAAGTGVQWAIVKPVSGGKLPTGQYQETYFKMISQNQPGFGPICASPINVGT